MISLEKWMILTTLQKLPNNVGNLGKIIVATGFEWLPKVQKSPNLVTLVVLSILWLYNREMRKVESLQMLVDKSNKVKWTY